MNRIYLLFFVKVLGDMSLEFLFSGWEVGGFIEVRGFWSLYFNELLCMCGVKMFL